ncbi:MAG TPA: carbon-nitrogen hydrolase family protein [Caulobacteraceae bacterium]|jgi:predicted amidohydrolase
MTEVALIQLRTPASQDRALAHAAPLVRQAAADGAKLIVTPEGANLLQRDQGKLFATLSSLGTDVFVAGFRALAAELEVWLLIGSAMVRREDGKAANRSVLIDPEGAITATYDKLHMFDVDLPGGERYRESSSFEPGDRAVTAEAAGVRLGLSVCYDLRFAALYRALARAGAQVLTIPAAFTRPTGAAHWEILLRARAIETGCFVLAPAQGGTHEDGRATWGRSLVVSPWGEVIARADDDEPGVVRARIDLAEVDRARAAIPALGHAKAFAGP